MTHRKELARKYLHLPSQPKEGAKRVLLVNPNWRKATYLETNVKGATLSHPVLSLPTLATPVLQAGHAAEIIDLDLFADPDKALKNKVEQFQPDLIGLTGTTPFVHEVLRINKLVESWNPSIKSVVGGAHATAYPEEFIEGGIDYAIIGAGDFAVREMVEVLEGKRKTEEVLSLCYRHENTIVRTAERPVVKLDEVPMPSWHLVDIDQYANSYVLSRQNPVGPLETSRGCPWSCHYCTKTIFGVRFNAKSPTRVVDEMEFMLQMG